MKRKYSPKNNQNEMTRLRRKNNFEQGDHEDKAALQKSILFIIETRKAQPEFPIGLCFSEVGRTINVC